MTTIAQVAQAFAQGKKLSCHNAKTDGLNYWLHGSLIASRCAVGRSLGDWCGYYTPTTNNHLRHIAQALKSNWQSGYANARDNQIKTFTF